jgi:hypothetical protein
VAARERPAAPRLAGWDTDTWLLVMFSPFALAALGFEIILTTK